MAAGPNIVMTRVDERLIHGQGQLWVKFLSCNTVIVACCLASIQIVVSFSL